MSEAWIGTALAVLAAAAIGWGARNVLASAWRQRAEKITLYQEMIACAAAFLPDAADEEGRAQARARFMRAYVSLTLIGSRPVIRACRRFIDSQSSGGASPQLGQDSRTRLAELTLAMRRDLSLFRNLTPPGSSGISAVDVVVPTGRQGAPRPFSPTAQEAAKPISREGPPLLRSDRRDSFAKERKTG